LCSVDFFFVINIFLSVCSRSDIHKRLYVDYIN